MSANGDLTLRCQAPGCPSPILRGAEREDGSNPDKPRGHAIDAQGRVYHFRCHARMLQRAVANPGGDAA